MSMRTIAPQGHSYTRRSTRLRVVPNEREAIASVHDISDAPSYRRYLERMRAEDPAMHRRPARPRSASNETPATLWHRIRATVLTVIVGALILAAGSAVGMAFEPAPYSGPTRVHYVAQGESVWELAQQTNSERPVEYIVADIERLNNLETGLHVGQAVILPTQ